MDKIVYKPLGNRVIVRPMEQKEEKKMGSIIVPEMADHLTIGAVEAVGKGEVAPSTGVLIPSGLKVSDLVLYRKEGAHIPLLDGRILMRENDIEAICENIPD
jgi:chaperonin GroES